MRQMVLFCGVLTGIFFAAIRPAGANGRPANTTGVVMQPGNPNNLMVSLTFGMAFSHNGGADWYWACEGVLGGPTGADNDLVWLQNGTMVVGNPQGVFLSSDNGCTWNGASTFSGTEVQDVKPHPTLANSFFVVADVPTASGASGTVYRSTDGGQTFTPLYAGNANAPVFSSIAIAPSDPNVLYVGSYMESGGCSITSSRDGGSTWNTTPVTAGPTPCLSPVVGITPADPNLVLMAALNASEQAFILRSTDGGATFTQILALQQLFREFVYTADGSIVWAADVKNIFRSQDGGQTFTQLPIPAGNACAALDNNTLFACGSAFTDQFALAQSSNDGNTFCPIFNLATIKFPPACPGNAQIVTTCEPQWPTQQAQIANYTLSPNVPAGCGPSTPKKGGCQCSGTAGGGSALLFAAGAALWRSRRKRS